MVFLTDGERVGKSQQVHPVNSQVVTGSTPFYIVTLTQRLKEGVCVYVCESEREIVEEKTLLFKARMSVNLIT